MFVLTSDIGILDRTELITEKSISATAMPVACRSGTGRRSAMMGFQNFITKIISLSMHPHM